MIIAIHIMYSTGEWLTSHTPFFNLVVILFFFNLSLLFLRYLCLFSLTFPIAFFLYRVVLWIYFFVFSASFFLSSFLSFYTFFIYIYISYIHLQFSFFTVFLASELENTLKFDDDDSNGVQNGRLSQVSTWATHVIIIHHLNKNSSWK